MTFDWSEWGPPLAVLAFGLVAGLVSMLQLKRREDTTVSTQGRTQDLVQAHEAAVEALKSLDLDQGKLDPSDYAREREALVKRGAAALRELESVRDGTLVDPRPPPPILPDAPPTPAKPPLLAPEWKGALTALAAVAVLAVLWQFAQDNSVARRDGASMTGNQDLGGGGAMQGEAPWMAAKAQMEADLAKDPSNLRLLNELTELSLSTGDAGAAMRYNQRAFEVDATHPDARVLKAVLAATVGMFDRALAEIGDVLKTHPDHAKAWTYKGLILLQQQDGPGAAEALERAVALQPGVPALQQALAQARSMSGAPAPAPAPAAGGAGEVVVSGVAELAPDAATALVGTEIVYVSVRDPAGGPPLAAKKLPLGPFPMTFEVTTADAIAMGGQARPFPANVNVSVRIDADGNPMTRAGEPSADLPGVAKGSSGHRLTLK